MQRPGMRISGPTIDAPDPIVLGHFYERLLGWTIVEVEGPRPDHPPQDGWVKLRSTRGDLKLEIQWDPHYAPPVWPSAAGAQLMMMHLDIAVDDLETGEAWAVECGATVAPHQPQADVRVLLDPAGHPFCLFEAPTDS